MKCCRLKHSWSLGVCIWHLVSLAKHPRSYRRKNYCIVCKIAATLCAIKRITTDMGVGNYLGHR
jgi:hypothetical protein